MPRRTYNRRQFLGYAGATLATAAAARYGSTVIPTPGLGTTPRRYSTSFTLSLKNRTEAILPGSPTHVLKFEASMWQGGGDTSLQILPNSYLGPVIRTRTHEMIDVVVDNDLDAPSVVHWHGLDNPPEVDGLPQFAVPAHSQYNAQLRIVNRAGTYWYHTHPDMITGHQAYHGLAGMIVVTDDEEQALDLPRQEFDVPLVIQDRKFDADNQLVYAMPMPNGMLGNQILVNGHPNYVHSGATRVYRFRLLNGSNSRIYKLYWSHSLAMTVIGTDGGLLKAPVHKKYVTLSPGERADVWVDFSDIPVGQEVVMRSDPFFSTGYTPTELPMGSDYEVMRVRIDRAESESLVLPSVLSDYDTYRLKDAVNRDDPRRFPISRAGTNYLLNGGLFDPNYVAPNERIVLGDLEVWEFSNPAGGSHIAHPIHVHGPQFQVLSRTIDPSRRAGWESVRWGYTDEGWKDTVLLMPGETIRILTRYHRYEGMSMYHCHNLEHEDMGMMRNLMVMPAGM